MLGNITQSGFVKATNKLGNSINITSNHLKGNNFYEATLESLFSINTNIPQIKLDSTKSITYRIKKYSLTNTSDLNLNICEGLYVKLTCETYYSSTTYNNGTVRATYNITSQIRNNSMKFKLTSSDFITIKILNSTSLEIYYSITDYCCVIKSITAMYNPKTIIPYNFNPIRDINKNQKLILKTDYAANCNNYLIQKNFNSYISYPFLQEIDDNIILYHTNGAISIISSQTNSDNLPNIYGSPFPLSISSHIPSPISKMLGYYIKSSSAYFTSDVGNKIWYTSSLSSEWSSVTLSTSATWSSPINMDGTILIYPEYPKRIPSGAYTKYKDSNKVFYSTNVTNWTESTLPITTHFNKAVYGNGTLILFNENLMIISKDKGKTFTQQNWTNLVEVQYINSKKKFIATANNNIIYTSTDGITWDSYTVPSTKVSLSNNASTIINSFFSTDMNRSGVKLFFHEVDNTYLFLPLGQGSYGYIILKSNDLISWEVKILPMATQRIELQEYNSQKIFIALHSGSYNYNKKQGITRVSISTDYCETWTDPFEYTGISLTHITIGTSGSNTIILLTQVFDSYEWDFLYNKYPWISFTYSRNTVRHENDDKTAILYSTNFGKTWNVTHLPYDNKYWEPPVYKNGTFIIMPASSRGYINSFYYKDTFVYSTNGITWYSAKLPYKIPWTNVIYSNKYNQFITLSRRGSTYESELKTQIALDPNFKNHYDTAIVGIPIPIERNIFYDIYTGGNIK